MKPKTADPKPPDHVHLTAAMRIDLAAEGADGTPKLPRFTMIAYTGGAMRIAGWRYPVVVDLAGLAIPSQSRPIRFGHDPAAGVGHTDRIAVAEGRLVAEGIVSRDTAAAKEVVASAKNGFPWQASVGTAVDQFEFVREGRTVTVNGREFEGPVNVVRKATLGEISFVDMGADGNTSARVAAKAKEQATMEDTEVREEPAAGGQVEAAAVETDGAGKEAAPPVADPVEDIRAAAVAETKRIEAIRKVCAGRHAEIEAQAIEGGWDVTKAELEVLRAERPKAPAVHAGGNAASGARVIEAAACLSAMIPETLVLKAYGEQTVSAADRRYRGIGLRGVIHLAAQLDGVLLPEYTSDPQGWVRAAFSTVSLPGILSNIANKKLDEGFTYSDQSWRKVVKIGSVSDFKPHTRYRLLSDMTFQPVGPDGELKHGELSETSSSIQADTSGILFGITRKMLINDDLGAFADIPFQIGMGWNDAISDAVWTLWLSNPSSFFAAGNKNYLEGADTALTVAGLTKARTLFLKQTRPQVGKGKARPLGIEPKNLIVPVELEETANRLVKATDLNYASESEVPNYNPHRGRYEVVAVPALSSEAFTGYSAAAWYLQADPNRLPTVEAAFLNGQQRPVIEQSEQAFNVLGKQFRGYGDFGVAMREFRAAVKMKGEA